MAGSGGVVVERPYMSVKEREDREPCEKFESITSNLSKFPRYDFKLSSHL